MQFAPSAHPTQDPRDTPLGWIETERKIPVETAVKFGATVIDGKLAFAFTDPDGELLYHKIRLPQADGGKSFRRDRSDVKSELFNAQCLGETCGPDDILIITEGEIDALSFLAIGCPYVVSVPDGAQLAKPGEGDIDPGQDRAFAYLWEGRKLRPEIAQFSKFLLATDDDEKGHILRDELAVRLGRNKCWWIAYPEGCKDANDVLRKYDPDTLSDALAAIEPVVPSRLVPFSSIPESGYREIYRCGWIGLDPHLKIVPPELIVVTGQPGSGKSQFTLALVANLAHRHGLKGAILQFEDNVERNRADLLTYASAHVDGIGASVDGDGVVTPPPSNATELAAQWVDRHFLTIAPSEDLDASNDYTLAWLQEAIEEAATRHGAKWIVIDPWNELEHIWDRGQNEAKYTNDALRALKRMARRFRIAVIVVTHPSKEGGKIKDITEMTLYDIAGASAWKNKADHGIIVHRDMDQGFTWVKVDKSKNHMVMGKPGIVRMRYQPASATYEFIASGVL